MSTTDFLDKEIANIKSIHGKLELPVSSPDVYKVEITLSGEEARSLYAALGAVITYYEFTKAME